MNGRMKGNDEENMHWVREDQCFSVFELCAKFNGIKMNLMKYSSV